MNEEWASIGTLEWWLGCDCSCRTAHALLGLMYGKGEELAVTNCSLARLPDGVCNETTEVAHEILVTVALARGISATAIASPLACASTNCRSSAAGAHRQMEG